MADESRLKPDYYLNMLKVIYAAKDVFLFVEFIVEVCKV